MLGVQKIMNNGSFSDDPAGVNPASDRPNCNDPVSDDAVSDGNPY